MKIILILIFLSLCKPTFCDQIMLLDGSLIDGQIISQDDRYIYIDQEGKTQSYSLKDIGFVQYKNIDDLKWKAKELYSIRKSQMDENDIRAKLSLANFCQENGLYQQARIEFLSLSGKMTHHTFEINQRLKQIDSLEAHSLFNKGIWWLNQSDLWRATSYFEKVIDLFPNMEISQFSKEKLKFIEKENKKIVFRDSLFSKGSNYSFKNIDLFISKNSKEIDWELGLKDISQIVSDALQMAKPKNSIQIFIFKDKEEYLKATHQENWSGGYSTYQLRRSSKGFLNIISQKIFLIHSPSLIESITHELTHVYLKHKFPLSLAIPKWFDEGLATYLGLIVSGKNKPLKSKNLMDQKIGWLLLFSLETYPIFEDIYYYESASIIQFLLQEFKMEMTFKFAYLLAKGHSFNQSVFDTFSPDADTLDQLEQLWIETFNKK